MGEIRTKVVLTNASDLQSHANGELAEEKIRRFEASAVVDSEAVSSVIPVHVLSKLGLRSLGSRVAQYADGRQDVVDVAAPISFDILGRETVDEALVLGDEVLIGQTVLEKLDLLADCTNQRLLPNPDHPDQPVLKIRRAS